MGRGRKPNQKLTELTWMDLFHRNVGVYLQAICIELSSIHSIHEDQSIELLERINAKRKQLVNRSKDFKVKELPSIKAEEIPFRIKENWVWCKLGDICSKIGSGSTPNGSNYSLNGVPFFRSQNIYNTGLIYNDIKFISNQVHLQMKGTTVYKNDLLLNITGGSLGRCALVPLEFQEGNVSQHVCIIRPILVNMEFFHYIILSPFFQSFIFSSTTGAGREGLPKYNLEQFLVPLPPLEEQQKIIAFLNDLEQNNLKASGCYFNPEIENRIITLHKSQLSGVAISSEHDYQLDLLKNLRQQILQDAVQGKLVSQDPNDEPASVLLERIKAEKEALIREKKIKKEKPLPAIKPEEIPFEIPGNWEWCRLTEICEAIIDCPHSTPKYLDFDTGFYGVDTNCINDKGEIIKLRALSVASYQERVRRLVPRIYDIVYAREGSIGLASFIPADKKICLGQRVMLFRPASKVIPTFLKLCVSEESYKNSLIAKHRGMGAKHVNVKDIVKSLIGLPPIEEQHRIVAKGEQLMTLCDELEQTIKQNQEYTRQLLQVALKEALEQ